MKVRELAKNRLRELQGLRLFVLVVLFIDSVVPLLIPYYMGYLLDHIHDPAVRWTRSILLLVFLIVIEFVLNWTQNFLWHKMQHQGAAILRTAMFEKVIHNPWSFFRDNTGGDIVNRILNNASQYASAYLIQIPMLVMNLIMIVFTMGFIMSLSVPIGIMLTVVCVIYFLSYRIINIKLREHARLESEQASTLYQVTQRYYDTIPTVKLFLREGFFVKKYSEYVEMLNRHAIGNQRWKSLALCLGFTLGSIMPVLSAIAGIYLMLRGRCTIGAIFSIYTFAGQFGEPIRNLTDYNITAQQGKVNERRLDDIICGTDDDGRGDAIDRIESISLKDISFSYNNDEKIFDLFNMQLTVPERIAVRGVSGAGKSTLIRLLTGQLMPEGGVLSVNEKQTKDINMKSVIRRTAVMTQDVFLFDDTIRNNILFGRDISEEKIDRLMRALGISEYLDRSINQLSGGEKQRVSLARVLAGEFDFLILDEPTSDLDMDTEQRVISFLDDYLREVKAMLLVVTHRPAILQICDRVVDLQESRIFVH